MRRERRRGFTLVELLVVIAIIGVLMAVLVPALSKARQAAYAVKCSANLHSVGVAMNTFLTTNKQAYPAAYTYRPAPDWKGPKDEFPVPSNGYIHWSSYLYGGMPGKRTAEAFKCPTLENGGLSATNPEEAFRDPGQANDPDFSGTEPDAQVSRCAYTVNEAIMPRNKFNPSIRGASSSSGLAYRYVKTSSVKLPQTIVLATEFWPDWKIVSEVGSEEASVVKSHRPVSGYYPIIGKGTDLVNGVVQAGARPTHKRVRSVTNPVDPQSGVSNTLGWVGRNHGNTKRGPKGENLGKTNFLYVDGHVETKTIEETLAPLFQWGPKDSIYSLPGASVVPEP